MGYIICEECGDYYELQPGERPENFSRCHCGGKLRYERRAIEEEYANPPNRGSPSYRKSRSYRDTRSYRKSSGTKLPSISNNIKILGGAAVLAIVFLLKFSPKLIGLSMEFFNFVPQNSAGTGFPFHYIIIALIAISAIATKILR